MSDIVERLRAKWKAAPMLGGGSLNGPGYIRDDGMRLRNPDGPEAAETILALRKEVEDAKADAALARQGYETAYAEFDDKCRTVNQLVVERNTLRRLLVKYGDSVRMATSNDDQKVIDDAFATLSTTEAK